MSTDNAKEGKGNGSSNTVPILVALISAIVTIIVAFKDPISARLFPTPTPMAPAQVSGSGLQPLATEVVQALHFEPCPSVATCPNAVSMRELLGNPNPFPPNTEYAADISSDSNILFQIGWCTKDQQWLNDNLPHLQFFFVITGVSYQDQLGAEYYTNTSNEFPSCYRKGVAISNWQAGVVYRVSIGEVLDADLFDGESTTAKGTLERTFVLTVK